MPAYRVIDDYGSNPSSIYPETLDEALEQAREASAKPSQGPTWHTYYVLAVRSGNGEITRETVATFKRGEQV